MKSEKVSDENPIPATHFRLQSTALHNINLKWCISTVTITIWYLVSNTYLWNLCQVWTNLPPIKLFVAVLLKKEFYLSPSLWYTWGTEVQLHSFLISALNGGVVNFMFPPLYTRKITPVPTEEEAGWAPEPVWTFWRGEKSLACVCLCFIQNMVIIFFFHQYYICTARCNLACDLIPNGKILICTIKHNNIQYPIFIKFICHISLINFTFILCQLNRCLQFPFLQSSINLIISTMVETNV